MSMSDPPHHLESIWLENIYEINKCGGAIFSCGGWNFSKSVSVTSRLLER